MFYVYKLLNPLKNNQPFYVGKGKDRRAYRHFASVEWKESLVNPHKTNTLKQIKNAGLEPGIEIICCDSEQASYDLEKELIKLYGRKIDGGILTNICFGGEGNSSGHIKVDQYNIYGEYMTTHNSLLEAANSVGVSSSSSIVAVCKKHKQSRTAFGYIWSYHGHQLDYAWHIAGKPPLYTWKLDGSDFQRYPSINDICLNARYDWSTINQFIRKHDRNKPVVVIPYDRVFSHHNTFRTPELIKSKRLRSVICIETNQVFDSTAAADRYYSGNSTAKNVSAACNGRQLTAYGYHWKFN